ncbi:MAG: hypothetical protein ABIC68_00940 [Candidatus Omnitrophota bacterium]
MNTFRRLIVIIVIFLSIFSCLAVSAFAAENKTGFHSDFSSSELEIRSIIKNPQVTIGEKIIFLIKVSASSSIEIKVPNFSEKLDALKVEDSRESVHPFFGKRFYTYKYTLRGYKPGEYNLTGLEVQYRKKPDESWQSVIIGDKPIIIKSVLGNETGDIRDIKGPLFIGWPLWMYLIVLIILFGGAWAVFVWMRCHNRKSVDIVVRESATAVALRRLKELKDRDFIGRGLVKEFYFHLSLIARQYLEDRFSLRAPEMTTEEFLIHLKDSEFLSVEHKMLLREFLFNCDLVKFAKYSPTAKEIDQALMSTVNLIEQTKPEEIQGQQRQ